MTFYTFVLHCHSILRYIALLLLIVAILKSFNGVIKKSEFKKEDLKIALFAMISFHFQFLIGLVLYCLSPKVLFQKSMFHQDMFRYFTLEHVFMMLIAIALITVGYMMAKKDVNKNAHAKILVYYTLTLFIVLLAIPWPFRIQLGGSWF